MMASHADPETLTKSGCRQVFIITSWSEKVRQSFCWDEKKSSRLATIVPFDSSSQVFIPRLPISRETVRNFSSNPEVHNGWTDGQWIRNHVCLPLRYQNGRQRCYEDVLTHTTWTKTTRSQTASQQTTESPALERFLKVWTQRPSISKKRLTELVVAVCRLAAPLDASVFADDLLRVTHKGL